LISPCPQPASSKTIDSKAADVIAVLKIFNCFIPELVVLKKPGCRHHLPANGDWMVA
jgi:hypothetical protein